VRTATQILDLLLELARQREDARAVVMNGSRVNPNAPQDIFCDYDVVFYVRQPSLFLHDPSWMARFGERVIVQQNDYADHGKPGHIFLMQFADGVRIDLGFSDLADLAYLSEDSLTLVLLDKDGVIPPLPPPSDTGYHVKPPTRKQYNEVTNEILWCATNVAKGLWRAELAYAHAMLDGIVRDAMLKLLAWYAASRHAWQVDTGKFGKWLPKYLPPDFWLRYTRTYAGPDANETWTALLLLVELASEAGEAAAQALGYAYPHEDHHRTLAYLQRVRAMCQEVQHG
jgi:aminoglycoside 6-adenylyltransferase